MRSVRVHYVKWFHLAVGSALALTVPAAPILAQDKPTGAPLALSIVETEQEVPLATLQPDGKTAKCVSIKLHWNPKADVGPNDDATSFSLDLPAENPAAPVFTAQLWSASLASAMAWQEPWQGARWKVLQTPVTDGTGLDAALAVGMIATSARRPYPPKTVVIGSLNPDGSLGPVSHLLERMNAAADAGMTRVIIPSVQRFDTDSSGQVINIVRHAGDLHMECVLADDLVTATEKTMNDPLPDSSLDSSVPKYDNDVASYIDDFAQREQSEASSGLKFAPHDAELSTYPPRLAAIWKNVHADFDAAQEAYRAGQVYVAYQLFARANGQMNGANALAGQTRVTFDVKTTLAESDDLHERLHVLMTPPAIDQGSLQTSLLVAEMADWAYGINAAIEGAQLVTKQAFSQRSDATDPEKDRAREAILFANAEAKYLLTQVDFYNGLLAHVTKGDPVLVEGNASHLLPQLIPAQLAGARSFTDGIRATDLRDGLLFDSRLVAYVNVLRNVKAEWDEHLHQKQMQADDAATAPAPSANGTNSDNAPIKPNAGNTTTDVGFNPGNTFTPPQTAVVATTPTKKLSDAALCLIWVNHDCEIATLSEKYLRLNGSMDPATHEWHVKDRAKLDAMLQMAEVGARHGIAFAEKAELNPSVLAMIYERAAHQRLQTDDASALDALRNYWRCALLGNVCWQLAHTHKAQPVDLTTLVPTPADGDKTDKKEDGSKVAKGESAKKNDSTPTAHSPTSSTNETIVVNPSAPSVTNQVITPAPPLNPIPPTNNVAVVNPPVPPPITNEADIPVAPIATNDLIVPTPPPAPENTVAAVNPSEAVTTKEGVTPVALPAITNTVLPNPPVPVPVNPSTAQHAPAPPPVPVAVIVTTNAVTEPAPPANDPGDANIPVAPIAKAEDYAAGPTPPVTNTPPIGPIPPSTKADNADGHSF
jgi:hypothetical protein